MKNANLLIKELQALRIEFDNFAAIKKLFSIIILTCFLTSTFSVAAQTVNRGSQGRTTLPTVQTSTKGTKPSAKVPIVSGGAACKGGWSGVINYSQTLDDSGSKNNKTERGESRHEWSRKINYRGTMIVDGSDAKATVTSATVNFTDVKRENDIEKSIDRCSPWKPEHEYVWDRKLEEIQTGNGAGAAESFFLYVDEARGTYKLSFTFPNVPGKYNREDHTSRSGWCQPKNNEPLHFTSSNTDPIKGGGGSADDQKINPNQPDVLEGSRTIDINDKNSTTSFKAPIMTFSWQLRRCPPPLIITDVKFYHLRYPSPSTWEEIENNHYTIDGNDVKIAATIVNLSGAKKSATVNFKELKENVDFPQGQIQASFEPHEKRTVEYIWDTSGYAWKEAAPWNKSEVFRQIEVKIPQDRKVAEVEVHPKPVVVVPGLWSKPEAFGKFVKFFNSNPNNPWAVQLAPVYPTKAAEENARVIDKTVRALQEKENAWHVDLAAHSTGGLAARAYVDSQMPSQYDNRPTATHLVMLGTPNMGTPCATAVDNIITRFFSRNPEAFGELSLENMRRFNEKVKLRHGTKFSILVGNSVAQTCQLDLPGDGITLPRSAIWQIKDWKSATVAARHEDMPGEQANFMQVYKWLAVPPKGNHAPDNSQASNGSFRNDDLAVLQEENFGKSRNYDAMFRSVNFTVNNYEQSSNADGEEPNFATGVKLAANETKEIEIPVTSGSRLSLVLFTTPNVSATLVDDKGETVGKNLAGSPEAAEIFRTINVKKTFQNGKWKLRLENRERTESEVIITTFIDYSSKLFQQTTTAE